jgi:hypothetical protein
MINNSAQWSHPRGNPVAPSPWQATQPPSFAVRQLLTRAGATPSIHRRSYQMTT